MKRIFVIGMALAFTLGITGLSFAAEKATVPMKHDDVKICGNVNCCGDQAKADVKKDAEGKKTTNEKKLDFRAFGGG